MRKLVNGKIVEVGNIELFERAAECIAINRTINSKSIDIKGCNLTDLETLTNAYISSYKSMPYPLHAMDDDIKYSVLANCVKFITRTAHPIWIDQGLFISIDKENSIVLGFVNDTWGILKQDNIKDDNTSIDLYKESLGYKEFKWVLIQILTNNSTIDFYNVHMKDFIDACNNQPIVMKWELGNILNFGNIPNKLELVNNKITDIMEKIQYELDIYTSGMRKTKEKQHIWDFMTDRDDSTRSKYVKSFRFDVYRKKTSQDEVDTKHIQDKLEKCELTGLTNLFLTLSGIRTAGEKNNFEDYTGIICDNNLIYEINNRIFIAKSNICVKEKEIARGVKIYSYDRGLVYLIKTTKIAPGIYKEMIYSYAIKDENLRLCKIQFVNK